MNRMDLYRLIHEVQQDHLQRRTCASHTPLKRRGRRPHRRPNTALIAEAAAECAAQPVEKRETNNQEYARAS